MSNDKNSILEIALTFVIGAPERGKKTRHIIQKEINKAGDMVKDNYEKIAKEAGKGIEAIASHLKP